MFKLLLLFLVTPASEKVACQEIHGERNIEIFSSIKKLLFLPPKASVIDILSIPPESQND